MASRYSQDLSEEGGGKNTSVAAAVAADASGSRTSSNRDPVVSQCRTMDDYDRLLRLKRRELDRKIEAFHAEKEKEFKLYERNLKKELNREKDRQRGRDAAVTAETERETAEGRPGGSNEPQAEALNNSGAATQDRQQRAKHPLQERDEELHGVFTPAYLPLLEGSDREITSKNKEATSTPAVGNGNTSIDSNLASSSRSTGGTTTNRRKKRRSAPAAAPICSSLTIDRSTFPSEDPSQQQASSAPRPGILDRRSSPRSDTSTTSASNLRSVLRQPRSPDVGGGSKSPKRVLFSIDNTVVAPSSSPSVTRNIASTEDAEDGGSSQETSAFKRSHNLSDLAGAGMEASQKSKDTAGSSLASSTSSTDESAYLPRQNVASVLSVRSLPPGLRMTPVRVPDPPTPPLSSARASNPLSPISDRPSSASSTEGPTSHPSPNTGASAPSSRSVLQSSSNQSLPFFDGTTTSFAPRRRRSSGGSSLPTTPSSAHRAADLLDPTVPAEERESAGGVPDVFDVSPGSDPLFDFGEGKRGDDFDDEWEERDESEGSSAAAGKKSKKKGKAKAHTSEEEEEETEDLEAAEDQILARAFKENSQIGAQASSLPIEIRWQPRPRGS